MIAREYKYSPAPKLEISSGCQFHSGKYTFDTHKG